MHTKKLARREGKARTGKLRSMLTDKRLDPRIKAQNVHGIISLRVGVRERSNGLDHDNRKYVRRFAITSCEEFVAYPTLMSKAAVSNDQCGNIIPAKQGET